jgi:hypothetical protein
MISIPIPALVILLVALIMLSVDEIRLAIRQKREKRQGKR